MKKIIRLNESELINLVTRVISEQDYDGGYESNEEWLDWKDQRNETLQKQNQAKKYILTSLMKFRDCLMATKQEFIEQYPNLRMANSLSWADDMESLTMNEQTAAQRMRQEIESGQYNWRNDISDMERQGQERRRDAYQQVRDRADRRAQNYAHLKPQMRLLRTIDEVLLLIDQVRIHQYGQGVFGLERLHDAAEFLVDHTEGIDSHIVKGISRCHSRFTKANLLNAKEQYLNYEKEYENLLSSQPTHTVNEEVDSEIDPCFEKSVKFYQSPEGRELLDLIRKQIDGSSSTPKFKLTREERRRLKYLLKISPKC